MPVDLTKSFSLFHEYNISDIIDRQNITNAIISNDLEFIKNVNIKNYYLIFCEASRLGKLEIVKYLSQFRDTNIHGQNDLAIVLARDNYHFDVVKFLSKLGLDVGKFSYSYYGRVVYIHEIKIKHKDKIIKISQREYINNLLHYILHRNDPQSKKMVKLMLQINGKLINTLSIYERMKYKLFTIV